MPFMKYGELPGSFGIPRETSFERISAGVIDAGELIMQGANSRLRSANFDNTSTGWIIRGDGSASFYGALNVSDIHASDGAEGTPSWSFASETDAGMYLFAANQLGFTVQGTHIWGMALASGDQSVLFANDGTADSLRYDSSAQHWKFELNSTVEFVLGLTGFEVPNVNNDFSGTGDDSVLIDSSNILHINTSTLKHKKNVTDYWRELAAMPLPSPIRFKSKQQYHKGVASPLNPRWQYGYSMESLEETDSYLVSVRDGKGHNYLDRALMALQGAHILKLEERIAALELEA